MSARAGGPATLTTAAGHLAAHLRADGHPPDAAGQAAACWAHTALVVLWLEDRGLLPVGIRAGKPLLDQWAAGVEGLAAHPATAGFADPDTSPAMTVSPTPDAVAPLAAALATSPDHGWDTWPVGDAYQELSTQAVRERALVQTPRFVADLIVKCTVERAMLDLDERARSIRVVDPACGTGHLLVAALRAARWLPHRAGTRRTWDAVDSVRGVDLDPYAALVARWRLAVECLPHPRPATWGGLDHDLPIHVAGGVDSLLDHHPLLDRGQYHAVVANPPYVTVKDPGARERIRAAYRHVCHGRYTLAVPFTVLLHQLAAPGGWVGQITSNAFMKREFGRPLVETFLPTVDLRWVIDTSGAYIPGHGTPTVVMVSRNQPPAGDTVRTVLGARGEPTRPADPARELVWTAIRQEVEQVESAERVALLHERHLRDHGVRAQAPPAPSAHVQATARQLFKQGDLFAAAGEVTS